VLTQEPGTPDAVRPRGLIPTDRQIALGAEVEEYTFTAPVEEDAPKATVKEKVVRWLDDVDPRQIDGPKLPVVIFMVLGFISAADTVAFKTLLPEIRAHYGLSLQFLASLASSMGIVAIIASPLVGYVVDRVKRVYLFRAATILNAVSTLLTPLAGGVNALLFARVIGSDADTGGLAKPVGDAATFPIIADFYSSRSRARIISATFISASVALIIMPTVVGRVGTALGWQAVFIGLALSAVPLCVLAFFLKEPARGEMDRLEMGASADIAANEQEPMKMAEAIRAARSISTLRKFWYATPFFFMGGAGMGILLPQFQASVINIDLKTRGYIGTYTGVLALIGFLVSAPVADRLLAYKPGRVLTLLGLVLVAVSGALTLLVLFPSLPMTLVALGIVIAGITLISPALITVMTLCIPARIRGLGLQTTAPFTLIGIVALPKFVGMADSYGLRNGIFVFIPMYLIAAFIFMSAAPGVERDIRAARAASMADEEAARAKASGRNKMLVCRDVDVEYDGVQVLFNVDFDVEEGEIIALLGTNGAGKSTLLRAIAGIQEASNGAIFLDGRDITHSPPSQNASFGVVMMPGGHATFPTLSVEENLNSAAWLYKDDAEYVRTRMEEVLGFFPALRTRLHEQAGNLSGGEQQMVGLGQAFLMKPRLLMIDELSLGLAPAVVELLLDVLRRIHAQGTTIVLVEQSLNVALTIAERAVFMEKGEIRFSGATEELLARPDLVRSVFMGGGVAGSASASAKRRLPAGDERETYLDVRDVGISFGGVQALKSATLDVRAGEVVGIIGPNGAGKTTLFDLISGFTRPDHGQVILVGDDVTDLAPDARSRLGLGRSFQSARLFPSLTVRENIAVALERKAVRNPIMAAAWLPSVRKGEARVFRRADGLIELLGLGAFANKFVGELSTGSRRAVDVACVMAAEPKVLLLDEPSSGLAQAETEELGPVLTRVVKDTGCGMLVIEHDLPLITSISDRLVAMELGTVLLQGEPGDVVRDSRVLASYLAASENVISRSNTPMAALARALGQEPEQNDEVANTTKGEVT
jgi:branched-chain amino acid transport system ATP-binding protein